VKLIKKIILFLSLHLTATQAFTLEVDTHRLSPDKSLLALAYDDHVIRLYSLASGKLLHELRGHTDSIQTLDFSSDGRRLVSGDWNDHAILWETQSGKMLKNRDLGGTVMNAQYSAGDKYLVVLVDEQLLTSYSPDLSQKKETFPIFNHLVHANNRQFFAGERIRQRPEDDFSVIVIEPNNHQQLHIPHQSYDDQMFFSPDGSMLVIHVSGSRFHTWDIQKGTKIAAFDVDLDVELASIIPSSNREILIYGDDGIETWDYQSGQRLRKTRLSGRNIDEIKHIAIAKDGKTAAVSAWLNNNNSEVYLMDLATETIIETMVPLSRVCFSAEFVGQDRLLLHSSYPFELWDIRKNQRILSFTTSGTQRNASMKAILQADFSPYLYQSRISALDVSPQGNVIITGTATPAASMEIDSNGYLTGVYQDNYIHGYDARYSHKGDLAAFAYHGEHLLVYDTKTQALQAEYDLGGVPSGTRILKFSRDDRLLAAGSDDGSVDIIDVYAKKKIQHIQFYTNANKQEESDGVYALAWLSDHQLLVGTLENLILVDLNSEEQTNILSSGVIALDTHFKGDDLQRVAVSRYNDESTLVLDASLKLLIDTKDISHGRIAFSDKGNQIIYTTDEGVHLWHLETGAKSVCSGPQTEVFAMAYDPKVGKIYAGGDDGKVFAWDMNCKPLN
jgi:WD40 repeat protein